MCRYPRVAPQRDPPVTEPSNMQILMSDEDRRAVALLAQYMGPWSAPADTIAVREALARLQGAVDRIVNCAGGEVSTSDLWVFVQFSRTPQCSEEAAAVTVLRQTLLRRRTGSMPSAVGSSL